VKDWVAWHAAYDDPSSPLSARLRVVRAHLSAALDAAPPGPVRLLSLCAGQGRDVLGVLPAHPRGPDVSALLVEYDPRNAVLARAVTAHRARGGPARAGARLIAPRRRRCRGPGHDGRRGPEPGAEPGPGFARGGGGCQDRSMVSIGVVVPGVAGGEPAGCAEPPRPPRPAAAGRGGCTRGRKLTW